MVIYGEPVDIADVLSATITVLSFMPSSGAAMLCFTGVTAHMLCDWKRAPPNPHVGAAGAWSLP